MATSQNDLMARIEAKIDARFNEIREDVKGQNIALTEIREKLAKWPPREDIVTHDLYGADKRALEARIRQLENKPTSARENLTMYGGCFAQLIFAGLSGMGTLIAIASIIITMTH